MVWRCFSLHFFRKNETKNRHLSRIAPLSRSFEMTGRAIDNLAFAGCIIYIGKYNCLLWEKLMPIKNLPTKEFIQHASSLWFFYRCVERAFLVTSFFFCALQKRKK